jgi:hypothetical protein
VRRLLFFERLFFLTKNPSAQGGADGPNADDFHKVHH